MIVVIDSTDRARIAIVRQELQTLLSHANLQGACILIFANKQVGRRAMPGPRRPRPSSCPPDHRTHCRCHPSACAGLEGRHDSHRAQRGAGHGQYGRRHACQSYPASPLLKKAWCPQVNVTTHNWHVQRSCALTGEGLLEGIKWIADQVKTKARPAVG